MQAFLPRHLVPMRELLVSVTGPGRTRPGTGKGQLAGKKPKNVPVTEPAP